DAALLECQLYPGLPIRALLIAPNGECVPDQLYRTAPIARRRLPEQPQRRIPRAVAAFDQPPPVRHERQEDPTRPAQSTCKMRRRSIDRDNQIQIEQSCRRLGKVRQLRSNVDELAFSLPKTFSFSLLQRIETDPRLLEQGAEASWFNRTISVLRVLGIAAPHDSNLKRAPRSAQPSRPPTNCGGIGAQIRNLSRQICECHTQQAWKTHERAVHIKEWQRLAAGDNATITVEGRRQTLQNFRCVNYNPCSAPNRFEHKAQKLNRVSQALLGVQKQGFAVEALALPCRLLEIARLHGFKPPAPLQLSESGRVVTAQQRKHGRTALGWGIIGVDGEGSPKAFFRPIKLQ